ncbi:alpha/beta hydrolase-fold protein [Rhodococcus sp. D-6]|uniref:Alpha/beta hydrolase-fold protein n=1 Tax=Rhodococcus sp. D-6 TaxID=1387842 RepID=A0AAU7V3X9_9NOCA
MRRSVVSRRGFRSLAVGLAGLSSLVFGTATAHADPEQPDAEPATAYVEGVDEVTDQHWTVRVYSPAVDTVIPLDVLRPADPSEPRPVVYALGGAGVGVIDGTGWMESSDIAEFFSDKNVNVVIPATGNFSYFTDWDLDDPVLGRNRWQTFLLEELPPVVDELLDADGKQSIIGMSMSAGSALDLAIRSGDLYSGVASLSGCVRTSDPVGQLYVRLVVERRGKGDVESMWGPADGSALGRARRLPQCGRLARQGLVPVEPQRSARHVRRPRSGTRGG